MEEINQCWASCIQKMIDEGKLGTKLQGGAAEHLVTCMSCPVCDGEKWQTYPDNHPAFDLSCLVCDSKFQIKASKGLEPSKNKKELIVLGTSYHIAKEHAGTIGFLIISYRNNESIRKLYYVKANQVRTEHIYPFESLQKDGKPYTYCTIRFQKGTYKGLPILPKDRKQNHLET